jgi:hypothetical protein
MSKSKNCRSVAPANEKEATKRNSDWRVKCEDCDIMKLCSNCEFGCELVDDSLKKHPKKDEK